MKTLSCFIILLMMLSYSDNLYAFQHEKSFIDSASLVKQKIKKEFKEFKKKKPRQIKRIATKDSTITYGADKNRTHITNVSSFNKLTNRSVQFIYNESGVTRIGILRRPKQVNRKEKKHQTNAYYFENGNLIYPNDRDVNDDLAFLLSEADRYLTQGRRFLDSHD